MTMNHVLTTATLLKKKKQSCWGFSKQISGGEGSSLRNRPLILAVTSTDEACVPSCTVVT
jgi:hypothetical protein